MLAASSACTAFGILGSAALRHAGRAFLAALIVGITGWMGAIASVTWLVRARHGGLRQLVQPIVMMLANFSMGTFGVVVTSLMVTGVSRGRQLRRFGRVLLPPLAPRSTWATASLTPDVPEPDRIAVAKQWRENGRTEHASVAAFARLTLDLIALGAPPDLIAKANRDALDEIRHAELCFSLARALDGCNDGPGPFPEPRKAATLAPTRTLALANLAIDSLIDGALHEGVSARIIAKLARVPGDAAIRDVLLEIAADEGRHSANGWHAVEWCLAEGGAPVARALLGAMKVIPFDMDAKIPLAARSGAWERWGIPGDALVTREYAATRAGLERRLRVLTTPLLEAAA